MNKYLKRYLTDQVEKDLPRKMVFVGGPRQVGKTTMAKQLLPDQRGYLSWDIAVQREKILKHELPSAKMWVFDEIHKYSAWRNYLKGVYDQFKDKHQILVTGSAHLDYYRRGGDSLQGRYFYLRMNPFSVAELRLNTQTAFKDLFQLGGFPEPYFSGSKIESKRWSREYRQRLIHEDIVALEQAHDLGKLELMMLRLPDLVGSPLSVNALREDLHISYATAEKWLAILCRLYAIFRIPPFGSPLLRAVKKEQKHYHYDWTLVNEVGVQFENMVAVHLLKWVEFQQDTLAKNIELRYFRDIDRREVDFIVVEERKPLLAIECKLNDKVVSPSLIYFKKKFPECDCYQISMLGKKDFISKDQIRVCPALQYLATLI